MAFLVIFSTTTLTAQTNRFVDPSGSDTGNCSDYGSPCQTIDYAVSQSVNGDFVYLSDGTFAAATISERITLKGNGTSSVVQGITVDAAVNGSDLVIISDLNVSGTSIGVGISTSYVTLDNVDASGHTSRNVALNATGDITNITIRNSILDNSTNTGLHISEDTGVNGLTVTNTTLDGNRFGLYFANGNSGILNRVQNVVVRNCTFNNNTDKGLYMEKLESALFENISVINSGTNASYGFNNGIDINLKWQAYSDITIRNSRVEGCGAIGSNDIGTAPENRRSSAIAIKARTDAPSYNSLTASLTNVTLDGVSIDGLVTDLRFGEMGKTDNDGIDMSTVTVSHCTIVNDNLAGLLNEENTNTLTISNNYWGGGAPSGTDIEDYGSGAGSTNQSSELANQIVDELDNTYISFANALSGVAAGGTIQNIPASTITGTTIVSKNVTLATPGAGLLDASNSLTTFEILEVNGGVLTLGSDLAVSTSATLSDDVILGDYNVDAASVTVNSTASVQDGVDMITSAGTVTVASGTYAESITIKGELTLDGSAGAILEPGSPSIAIDIDSDNVTIDGFQIGTDASNSNATIGIQSFRNDNITIQNNTIYSNTIGINAVITETGILLIDNNVISMLALEDVISGAGSIGLNLQHGGGDSDIDITNNDFSNAVSGIIAYALTSSNEAMIDGGNYTGCTTGILPINTDGVGFSPSTLTVQNLTMTSFATDVDVSDTETGVYVVTAGGSASDDIIITIDNLDISGVNNDLSNYSGIVIGDFPSVSDGAGIDATIINCNIHDNANRGIYTRGGDAITQVIQSSIVDNGFDPTAVDGNPGFSIIAREGSTTTVSNSFISNPASLSGAENIAGNYYVSGLHISTGGSLTVSDCNLSDNGNGFIAETAGIDLSGNYFNTIDEATIDAAVNSNDFTPWLRSGTDTDVITDGFQGDFSDLIVGVSGAQTGVLGRIEEGVGLVDAAGTVAVNAGTYSENLTISKSVILNGANQGIAGSGSRTAESIIEPLAANIGISVGAVDITIDGFQFGTDNTTSNNSIAISNAGFSGLNISNNVIFANTAGISISGLSSGISTISSNAIEMLNLEDPLNPGNPSFGINVQSIGGTADVDFVDNDIQTASYGLFGFALTSAPVVTIDGGNYTGCTKGIEINNTDGLGAFSPSNVGVANVTMSGFVNPDTDLTQPDTQAGIYVFTTGLATAADDIVITINNVDISGIGNAGTDYAAIYIADFQATGPFLGTDDDGIGITADITNSNIHDNLNRGIHTRGRNAISNITACTLTDNGTNPSAGAGAAINVYAQGTASVQNSTLTNPTTGTTSLLVSQQQGTIIAFNNSLDNNGNATGLLADIQSGTTGSIDMSGNWLGETSDATILALIDFTPSDIDFTPYLGSAVDSDGGTPGFQGDFDALTVTPSGFQTNGDRVQEGHDLVNTDGTITILQDDYAETLTVSKNITVDPEASTTIDDVTLNGGRLTVLADLEINNVLTLTNGVLDIDLDDGNKDDDPSLTLNNPISGTFGTSNHVEGKMEVLVGAATLFTFPAGDEGAYRPVDLTPTNATTFVVSHVGESAPIGGGSFGDMRNLHGTASSQLTGNIESTLTTRYWDIDVISGTPGVTGVTLQIEGSDEASDPSTLGMLRFDGSDWLELTRIGAAGTGPFTVTGQTSSFSEFSIYSTDADANPLPVELVDFKGRFEDRDIRLSWSTLTEVNSDFFQIERSDDGVTFAVVGNVATHGNSSERHNYGFVDMNVKTDIHYYRLKIVDLDGSYEYSPIIRVSPEVDINQVLAYPNPSQDFIYLKGIHPELIHSVRFYDMEGKLRKTFSKASETLNISNFKSGQYIVRVELVGGKLFEGKILKE